MHKQLVITGAICALLSVALGAFAAHGLKQHVGPYEISIWQTAVEYQMYHSIGILLIGLLGNSFSINLNKPGWIMFVGILFFSGSLYTLVLTGTKVLGIITPIGGTLFIIAWAWLAISLYKRT